MFKAIGLKIELEVVHEKLMGISENYNANPYVFAVIYVGAMPFLGYQLLRLFSTNDGVHKLSFCLSRPAFSSSDMLERSILISHMP